MNTSELKQFYIVKRVFKRDPLRILQLREEGRLKVHTDVFKWLDMQDKEKLWVQIMNKYEKSLEAFDALLANTTAEEFEKDYLSVESNLGITVEDYLNQDLYTVKVAKNTTLDGRENA